VASGLDNTRVRFRRRRRDEQAELSLRPISNWMLLLAVVAVAIAGGGLTWWLLTYSGKLTGGPDIRRLQSSGRVPAV
jgi:hypothetical protein